MNMNERACLVSGLIKHVGAMAMAAMMVVVVSFVTSCGNSEKRYLNALLVELAADDATIDAADWTEITDYIDGQKNHFKNFLQLLKEIINALHMFHVMQLLWKNQE